MALFPTHVRVRKRSEAQTHFVVDPVFDPYPISDGAPMTNSQEQYFAMTYSRFALSSLMETRNESCILVADFGLYYEPIDPALNRRAPFVAPDITLVLGVALPKFTPYLWWEVGKAPDLVLEIVSSSTRSEDAVKRVLYARLGIAEYWQYEPPGERLTPGLECCRLVEGRYVRVLSTYRPELGALWIWSPVLGTAWGLLDTGELRLWDPERKEWFPTDVEMAAQRDQAERERDQAKRGMQTEQERMQAEQERDQAKRKMKQAQQEWTQIQRQIDRLEAEIQSRQGRLAASDRDAAAPSEDQPPDKQKP